METIVVDFHTHRANEITLKYFVCFLLSPSPSVCGYVCVFDREREGERYRETEGNIER